jgi:peptidoglycan/LPS O-acetylase OafA/YrhL
LKVFPQNEIGALTGLRGVACIYVMLFHFSSLLLNFNRPRNVAVTFLAHGYLAVDLFFALSGFVMALNYSHSFADGFSKTAYSTFLSKRIARIYPLYFICTIIGFMLFLVGSMRVDLNKDYSILVLLYNVAMVQVWGFAESFNGPEWSISAEWAAYLCFPALLSPLIFKDRAIAVTCVGGCVAALFAVCYIPNTILQGRENGSLHVVEPWYGYVLHYYQ